MANFNTNQARHFYAAKEYKSTVAGVTAVGDIYVGATGDANGNETLGENALKHVYFIYKNGDGLITRSDSIPAKNIAYVNKVAASDMNRDLLAHTITLNSSVSGNIDNSKLYLNVMIRGIVDDDPRNCIPVVAYAKVGANVVASTIYKDIALSLAKALPTFANPQYPAFKVFLSYTSSSSTAYTEVTKSTAASSLTGSYTAVVLVPTAQKWRRGLMSNDPYTIDVSFTCDKDIECAWGNVAVAVSTVTGNTSIASAYALADEEWFSYGERGDEARGYNYPNNYEPAFIINPLDTSTTYDVMTIQYYWQGNNENVQKSQKTIRIAAPHDELEDIYEAFCVAAGLVESTE